MLIAIKEKGRNTFYAAELSISKSRRGYRKIMIDNIVPITKYKYYKMIPLYRIVWPVYGNPDDLYMADFLYKNLYNQLVFVEKMQ